LFHFFHAAHANFGMLDVTLLFGLYAVMVNNCSGVDSSMTTFVQCMPLVMLIALMIICACLMLFSESSDLPELSEVVLLTLK
jgi:hypothetical protein